MEPPDFCLVKQTTHNMTSNKIATLFYFFIATMVQGQAQTSSNMQINQNAPVKQNNAIFIQASPEKVWEVLTNINNWPNWNTKISRAQIVGPVAPQANFKWKVNRAKINSNLHTVETNRVLGWSGTTFGGSAIHNWYLSTENNGTRVQVEESMEGWLVGLFKKKMNKDLATDMQAWLDQLKAEVER